MPHPPAPSPTPTGRTFLARHGQDQDNAAGLLNGRRNRPLTPLGRLQATQAGEKLTQDGLSIAEVWTSPLQRARRTAVLIRRATGGGRLLTVPELIERDFGVLTGRRLRDIPLLCQPEDLLVTATIQYFLRPQGGETFEQAAARAAAVVQRLRMQPCVGHRLLVCHGDIGKLIFAAYYGLPWREVLVGCHFGNADIWDLSPSLRPGRARVWTSRQSNP